jgi:hypothetical protein
MTDEEAQPISASEAARILSQTGASLGGRARADSLTPAQRSEIARNAAQARWAGTVKKAPVPRPARKIGPPPAGPLMCLQCLTGTCKHDNATRASSAHGGGLVPAITMKDGASLCLDCASGAQVAQ